jgi:hypothetical protein
LWLLVAVVAVQFLLEVVVVVDFAPAQHFV